MRIGIIGGGLMGLALAERLSSRSARVEVLEQADRVGGLTTWQDYGAFTWDRFYHVILPSDRSLIRFIDEIGLGDELHWRQTKTGFFVDRTMHSISSNAEFLRFPLLTLADKARLAWTLLYGSKISDWRRLETMSAEQWLRKVSGDRNWEKLWRPLLLAKLGANYERVSAVFIWSYIKRLFSARDTSASKEHLGHVTGGYRQVFDRLLARIRAAAGAVETGVTVTSLRPAGQGGIEVTVAGEDAPRTYDKLVCTSPVPVLETLAGDALVEVESAAGSVEYLGVVCVVLVTRAPLVPYYVVNIADETVPFTGIIGMSSVVDPGYTAGQYLAYLPKYVLSTDPWFEKDDAFVVDEFMRGLRRILPDFDEGGIVNVVVNRARRVQPLQVMNYSSLVPKIATRHPDFFVLNTAQFVNATLNNNEVIRSVDEFVASFGESLLGAAEAQAA